VVIILIPADCILLLPVFLFFAWLCQHDHETSKSYELVGGCCNGVWLNIPFILNSSQLHLFSVYDDYKFVTRSELESLGLAHLVGTEFLRAYMHGFFLDIRLYHKVVPMFPYILPLCQMNTMESSIPGINLMNFGPRDPQNIQIKAL